MKYLRGHRWRFSVAGFAVAMGVYLTITLPPGTPAKPSAAYRATEQALNAKLRELNWAVTPLNSALNEIERGAGLSIKCDLDAFRADGIDQRRLVVTARLRDLRAGKALEVVLADASPHGRLRYFIADDGTIVVTTPRGDARRAVPRVYNVSDLTFQMPSSAVSPEQAARTESQLNDDITRLITETVDPETWTDAGGEPGRISLHRGILTVHHTPERLWLIERLLGQIREGQEAEHLGRLLQGGAP